MGRWSKEEIESAFKRYQIQGRDAAMLAGGIRHISIGSGDGHVIDQN